MAVYCNKLEIAFPYVHGSTQFLRLVEGANVHLDLVEYNVVSVFYK